MRLAGEHSYQAMVVQKNMATYDDSINKQFNYQVITTASKNSKAVKKGAPM